VSLLWRRKKLRIGVCADRIIVARGKSLAVQRGDAAAEWQPAVAALAEILAKSRHAEVSVVLAASFVRYALLPYSAALKAEEQWLALARHRMAAVHGARAADWELKITATAPQGPRLVCALERELIAALNAQFAAAEVRLASVQPFLVAAFNQIRRQIGNGSCWLVVEEPGRLTLALIQRGIWVAIRSRRCDERWREMLPEILDRESAFLALDAACTRLIVCAQGSFDTTLYQDWRTQALSYPELATAWE
jgi:hypothetical protein